MRPNSDPLFMPEESPSAGSRPEWATTMSTSQLSDKALANFFSGKHDVSIVSYEELFRRGAGNWRDYERCGRAYFSQGEYRSAIDCFTSSIKGIQDEDPEQKTLLNSLVSIICSRGDSYSRDSGYGKALEDFSWILRITTDVDEWTPRLRSSYFFRRASMYRRLGQNDKALDDISTAIDLVPAHPMALADRALMYGTWGRKECAERDLETVFADESNERNDYCVCNRGILNLRWGNYEAAIEDFGGLIEIASKRQHPDSQSVSLGLWRRAYARLLLEDYEEARKDFFLCYELAGEFTNFVSLCHLVPRMASDFEMFLPILGENDATRCLKRLLPRTDSGFQRFLFVNEMIGQDPSSCVVIEGVRSESIQIFRWLLAV